MASTAPAHSSGSVSVDSQRRSRKYASIYDAIDAGNYRQALKLCEKRDIANTMLAKALKARVLERVGSRDEALALTMEVVRSKPTDAYILQPLETVLKCSGETATIIQMYEAACTGKPEDERLQRLLAFATLCSHDFKRFQACAMRLYKLTSKAAYLFWAAVAIHCTVATEGAPSKATGGGDGFGVAAPANDAGRNALKLAETMLERCLDKMEGADRDSEQLGLFVHTLLRLGKPAQAHEAIIKGKLHYVAPTELEPEVAAAAEASEPAVDGKDNGNINDKPDKPEEGEEGEDGSGVEQKDGASAGGVGGESEDVIPFEERAPEEDVLEPADGMKGRGKSPGPLQPVDHLRYAAFLLTHSRDWPAAQLAYGALLSTIDMYDWAYHSGMAYCVAQQLVEQVNVAVEKSDEAALQRLIGPLPADVNGGVITGVFAVDEQLHRVVSLDASQSSRGLLLAALQLLAVRLELAWRLTCRSNASCAASLFDRGGEQYVRLLCHFADMMAHKASCLADVKAFLVPLHAAVGELPAPLPLDGFMAAQPGIQSMPFSPAEPHTSASSLAAAQPLFTWSFVLPSDRVAPFVEHLKGVAAANALTSTFSSDLNDLVRSARDAALGRDRHAAESEGKKGRAGGKGDVAEGDPHGVQEALAPTLELLLTPAQEEALAAARARVRRFTAAQQLLRHLDQLSVRALGKAGARAAASALVDAWLETRPIATAAVGGQREGLEGDALLLLACHVLWDIAFHYALPSLSSRLTPAATCSAGDASAICAARNTLIESAILLEAALALSPHSAQLRLAMLRVAGWLGVSAVLIRHWGGLRVKHVMLDTLSHLVMPSLTRITWLEALKACCEEVHHFHRLSLRENAEYMKVALRCGNYSQVIDMERMSQRLSQSATALCARSAYAMLGMSIHCRSLPEAATHLRCAVLTGEVPEMFVDASAGALARTRDNEDRDVGSSWRPLSGLALQELRSSAIASALQASDSLPTAIAGIVEGWQQGDGSDVLAGGMLDRAVRRVVREAMVQYRHNAQAVLMWCLNDNAASAAAPLAALELLVSRAVEGSTLSPLLCDVTAGTVPLADAGLSTERLSTRSQCYELLLTALRACVAAVAVETDGANAEAPAWEAVAAGLQALGRIAGSAADSIAGAAYLTSDPAAPTSLAKDKQPDRPPAQALNLAFLPECSLLVQHTMPYVAIALARIAKALKGSSKEADAKAKSSGKTKPSNPLLTAAAAAKAAVADVSRALGALNGVLTQLRSVLTSSNEVAETLLLTGFDAPIHCCTRFVRELFAARTAGAAKSASASSGASNLTISPIADAASGEALVTATQHSQAAVFQVRLEASLQSLGASFTDSVEKVRGELQERLAFVRTIKL